MTETYTVDGYMTTYNSIVKARAAAYRMYKKKSSAGKFGTRGVEVKIFKKVTPGIFSEYLVVADHPWIVGAAGAISNETGEVARLDSKGMTYNWEPLAFKKYYKK